MHELKISDSIGNGLELSGTNEYSDEVSWSDACCGCSGRLSLEDLRRLRTFIDGEIAKLTIRGETIDE